MFLSSRSKENLSEYLPNVSLNDYEADFVVLKSNVDEQDLFLYEPLLGQRVAFRLKGIIKSGEKCVVSKLCDGNVTLLTLMWYFLHRLLVVFLL